MAQVPPAHHHLAAAERWARKIRTLSAAPVVAYDDVDARQWFVRTQPRFLIWSAFSKLATSNLYRHLRNVPRHRPLLQRSQLAYMLLRAPHTYNEVTLNWATPVRRRGRGKFARLVEVSPEDQQRQYPNVTAAPAPVDLNLGGAAPRYVVLVIDIYNHVHSALARDQSAVAWWTLLVCEVRSRFYESNEASPDPDHPVRRVLVPQRPGGKEWVNNCLLQPLWVAQLPITTAGSPDALFTPTEYGDLIYWHLRNKFLPPIYQWHGERAGV